MFVTFSTFPIVNNRQMTKAKSIMELLIVAMIMLCGALVRTFFTSSPVQSGVENEDTILVSGN